MSLYQSLEMDRKYQYQSKVPEGVKIVNMYNDITVQENFFDPDKKLGL